MAQSNLPPIDTTGEVVEERSLGAAPEDDEEVDDNFLQHFADQTAAYKRRFLKNPNASAARRAEADFAAVGMGIFESLVRIGDKLGERE